MNPLGRVEQIEVLEEIQEDEEAVDTTGGADPEIDKLMEECEKVNPSPQTDLAKPSESEQPKPSETVPPAQLVAPEQKDS